MNLTLPHPSLRTLTIVQHPTPTIHQPSSIIYHPSSINHPQHKLDDTEAKLEAADEKLQISEFERKWAAGRSIQSSHLNSPQRSFRAVRSCTNVGTCHLGTSKSHPRNHSLTHSLIQSLGRRWVRGPGHTERDRRQAWLATGLSCIQRSQ